PPSFPTRRSSDLGQPRRGAVRRGGGRGGAGGRGLGDVALQQAAAVRHLLQGQRGADRGARGGAGGQGRGRAAGSRLGVDDPGAGAARGPARQPPDAGNAAGAARGAGRAGGRVRVERADGAGVGGGALKTFAASAAPTRRSGQCLRRAFAPVASVISTSSVKLRWSPGSSAPTPITWRCTSSP